MCVDPCESMPKQAVTNQALGSSKIIMFRPTILFTLLLWLSNKENCPQQKLSCVQWITLLTTFQKQRLWELEKYEQTFQ